MNSNIHFLSIQNYTTSKGEAISLELSYEIFGLPLHSAPVVLCLHALTGNSNVAGEKGWWSPLVKEGGSIDLSKYTVLCFNVPGNGYASEENIEEESLTVRDVAELFLLGLKKLKINKLHSLVGGSLGGAIGLAMSAKEPQLSENLIVIAADYRTSDWLFGQCLIQSYLLSHPENPLEKARAHAMLCYRTPESLNHRFKGEIHSTLEIRKSHDWLNYHGRALSERFTLRAYKQMNYLLGHIEVEKEELLNSESCIHIVAIDSDLFFPRKEMNELYGYLKENNKQAYFHLIESPHGHDAFLMEYERLEKILNSIY